MNQAMMMKMKKMQKELEQAQARIQNTIYTGQAAGIVTIELKGNHELVSIKINPDALESKDDIEMIEDSILSAYKEAMTKLEKEQQQLLGSFSIPGLF